MPQQLIFTNDSVVHVYLYSLRPKLILNFFYFLEIFNHGYDHTSCQNSNYCTLQFHSFVAFNFEKKNKKKQESRSCASIEQNGFLCNLQGSRNSMLQSISKLETRLEVNEIWLVIGGGSLEEKYQVRKCSFLSSVQCRQCFD